MKIRIKGYYPNVVRAINNVANVNWQGYDYIRFSTRVNAKMMFDLYKLEMQQGEKPSASNMGRRIIQQTGFFDAGYKHWTEFERFNPRILYRYEIIDSDLIEISPLNCSDVYGIDEEKILNV